MDAVRDVANGHLVLWPAGKQRLEDAPAHFAVQLAHAVDRATAAYRQIRHVERFLVVVGILSTQGHQVPEREAQLTLGVIAEMLPHQMRREAIETRGHGGVGGEEIPGPRHLERHVEGLPRLLA